ncbi:MULTISPECIES: hypothetical protein [Aerosakkonema]
MRTKNYWFRSEGRFDRHLDRDKKIVDRDAPTIQNPLLRRWAS